MQSVECYDYSPRRTPEQISAELRAIEARYLQQDLERLSREIEQVKSRLAALSI